MSQTDNCVEPVGVFTNDPAQPQGPGPFVSPACYTVPPSLVLLPGYLSVTLNPNGSINTSTILDAALAPAVGAVQAPCPAA